MARHRSVGPKSLGSLSLGSLSAGSKYVRIGAAGAVVAGLAAGGVGLVQVADEPETSAADIAAPSVSMTPTLAQRELRTSRNQARPKITATPSRRPATKPTAKPTKRATTPKPSPTTAPKAIGSRYATAAVNVRAGAGKHFTVLDQLTTGDKISITGAVSGTWTQVIEGTKIGWIATEFLSKSKPDITVTGGVSSAPCKDGSAVEDGLVPDTIRVHRAVCALFPGVDSYGGVRSGDSGEHGSGQALDIMISDSSLGDDVAEWVRDHASELGVSEVIWEQKIWTVQRSSEGWRPMEDRGSATANHYDHVHVTTYGDEGTA
jgi:SH3 domain-containing protein